MNETPYSFNNQEYDVVIRLYNEINDIYLTNAAWDDLYLEDNILNIFINGQITINTPYDLLERESDTSILITNSPKEQLVYKFRNDGRDTLYISIKPRPIGKENESKEFFTDDRWLLELECVIYDVKDIAPGTPSQKRKVLYFWEKTYQLMLERDSDFSTSENSSDVSDQINDSSRSLSTGTALGNLILKYPEFAKHGQFIGDPKMWNSGTDENFLFYTSPINSKFIDDLMYLYSAHISSDEYDNQPCILKLERALNKGEPRQFTLKSIQQYFEYAGKQTPGEYQYEHFFIRENDYDSRIPRLQKAPLDNTIDSEEIKADDYSIINNYQITDFVGKDFYNNLADRRVVFFNHMTGQFNVDSAINTTDEWKKFYKQSIAPNIQTKDAEDRLPRTPYMINRLNTTTSFSTFPNQKVRLSQGRNKMLNLYLYSNLGISFYNRGLTHRQPGRFFGLSKLTANDKEYDHLIEGQYFTTEVIHHFSNTNREYSTQIVGVKTHMYQNLTPFPSSDVMLITGEPNSSNSDETNSQITPKRTEKPIIKE